MSVPQQKFREVVFQLLYSHDMTKTSDDAMIQLLMKELSISKKTVRDAQEKMRKILEKLSDLDARIASTSVAYEIDRISNVERNVLRLGLYELLYDDSIPPKVAISEAMRLSRKFGTPESASFVNALLDAVYQSQQKENNPLADNA